MFCSQFHNRLGKNKMKSPRVVIAIRWLLMFLGLAACNLLQPALPTAVSGLELTEIPTTTPVHTPSATPQSTDTQVQQTEISTENTYYVNEKYKFSFVIPEGWLLEEIYWEEMEGPTQAVVLTKGDYRIVLHFKTVFEDVFIGPRGLGGSDVEIVKLNEIPILGKDVVGHSHVSEGKTKRVMYGVNTNEFRLFAGLNQETSSGLEYNWENIEIPQEIQFEFINLLKTFTRTGEVELPESVVLLADIPLILPIEKTYYSQIYDTDVANACGPAVALIVLDYYGLEDSMDVVITQLKNMPSPGAFDPGCYINTVCTSPDALTRLFYEYGLWVYSHEDWTLAEIFAVISKGNPIVADILWDSSTESLGHFVVIYGVDLNQQILYYHDPYRGREMTAHWNDFADLWEGRVDVGDPLKPEGHQFWGLEIGAKPDQP